jgi:hypothetical protein
MVRKHGFINRWSGSLESIREIADVAYNEVVKADGPEWKDQQHCRITFETDDTDDSLEREDFPASLPVRDVPRIKELRVYAAGVEEAERISVTFKEAAPAVKYEVHLGDRTQAEGVVNSLRKILKPGEGRASSYKRNDYVYPLLVTMLAFMGLGAWVGARLAPNEDEPLRNVPLFIGLGLALSVTALVYWLTPDLQLLVDRQKTRFQRFRGLVYAVVVGIAVSIISAVIIALAREGG